MKQWAGLLARLVVGGVWLVAGVLKLGDPSASAAAVRAYELLPGDVADQVGYLLPALEAVLGLALVLGLLTRGAAVLSAGLLCVYIFGISWAWAQGLNIDCGCFGGGGVKADASASYPWDIARDVGLVLLSAFVVWLPATRLALDHVLFRSPPEPAEPPEPDAPAPPTPTVATTTTRGPR